ncbi:MAG: NAD-dependent epimerase/dehydratase family protein [Gemmatimonadota bacterium]
MIDRVGCVVTGAAGFIGRHLATQLAAAGYAVRAVDVKPRSEELERPAISYFRIDLREPGALGEILDGAHTVFHLASTHLEVGATVEEFEAVNVRATEALVELCAQTGVRRLVHTSSVGIYGHVADPPAREESPKNPQTPYERSKLAGEMAALKRAGETGLWIVVLRPTWVYGPGCPRTAKLLRAIRTGRFFYVGDGSNLRHPLYIGEMINAFQVACAAPEGANGRAYIIGGPETLALRTLVETCAAELEVAPPALRVPRPLARGIGLMMERGFALAGRQPPFSRRSLAFFENDNAFDIGRASRELGFKPRVSFAEGIRRTIDAMSER